MGDAAKFYRLGFVQFIDAKLYDYRLRLTLPNKGDDRIVILDIDEKSLKEDGRWPWGRDKMAALMDELFDHYGSCGGRLRRRVRREGQQFRLESIAGIGEAISSRTWRSTSPC